MCTFVTMFVPAHPFRMDDVGKDTKTYLFKFSHRISTSIREINEQNPNSCWSVRISADFIHKELGVVLNPV